jgi:hypothetical protein
MSGRPFDLSSDAALESALRDLAPALAWPAAQPVAGAPDIAMRVRTRIVAGERERPATVRSAWRPMRRSLVLALAALLVLAAVAAAVALGVPGIRLSFGVPPATPPPSIAPGGSAGLPSGPPGAALRLGRLVALDAVDDDVPFAVRVPTDPRTGQPAAAWVSERDEVTLTWAPSADLPPTMDPAVGLLLTQFRGTQGATLITKVIDSGTAVARVTVNGATGYWIDGDPHFSFYETPEGEMVEETRRWVGDALIWSEGEITYRLETSLGREAAVRIASTLE